MAKSPSEIAAKWARRTQAATTDYVAGVNAVTENPAEKAIAAIPKMQQNFNAAITDGRVESGFRRVTLASWRDATTNKGGQRYAPGCAAAEGKMQQFMTEFMPHVEAGQAIISNMADLTIEDSVARAAAWIRHAAEFNR